MASTPARWLLPCAIALAISAVLLQLGWEYTHGGILRHHLLNDASMPAISNAWGLVVLPMLGALAGWVVARRVRLRPAALFPAAAGCAGALLAGATLSVAFVSAGESAATWVMLAVLIASAVLPVYRVEYLFGFVLGMMFVFGPVLPAIVACVPMLISALSRLIVWPAITWLLRRSQAGLAR